MACLGLTPHERAVAEAELMARIDRWLAARPSEERIVLARYRPLLEQLEWLRVEVSELHRRLAEFEESDR
jgi:hypothetical protein